MKTFAEPNIRINEIRSAGPGAGFYESGFVYGRARSHNYCGCCGVGKGGSDYILVEPFRPLKASTKAKSHSRRIGHDRETM